MDKEAVLKPLDRLIELLNNTQFESEALKVKEEINELWKEEEFQFYANNVWD